MRPGMAKRKPKAKRARFWVFYDAKAPPELRWCLRRTGGSVSFVGSRKEAIGMARDAARIAKPSQLFIKGTDGKIKDERTYGADPRRTKG